METENKNEDKVVNQADIEAVEKEIKAKEAETAKLKQDEMKKLLDEAEKKGKEVALKELEEKQRWEAMEKSQKELQEKLKKAEEQRLKDIEATRKEMEDKLAEQQAHKRGLSKNESPFNKSQEEQKIDANKLDLDEVDRLSRTAFFGFDPFEGKAE